PESGDEFGGHRRVVALGPHRPVLRLQRTVGLGRVHHVRHGCPPREPRELSASGPGTVPAAPGSHPLRAAAGRPRTPRAGLLPPGAADGVGPAGSAGASAPRTGSRGAGPQSAFAYVCAMAPAKSCTTTCSSPTTHASCPGGQTK